MVRRLGAISTIVAAITLLGAAHAAAAAGALDPSFSNDGVTEVQIGQLDPAFGQADAAALAPIGVEGDGSVTFAGTTTYKTFCYGHLGCSYQPLTTLVRLDSAGRLDPSLDGDGVLEMPPDNYDYFTLFGASQQPDGKILLGGGFSKPFVVRLNRDGTPDATFGDGGFARFTVPNQYSARVVATAPLPGGNVVAAVDSSESVSDMAKDLNLVRLHPDGTIDQSFGSDGIAQVRLPGTSARVGSLVVLPDGHMVAGTGSATTVVGNFNGQLDFYRFNENGSLDPAFGDGGHVTYPVGNNYAPGELKQIVADSQGRVYSLVSGSPTSVLRLTPAGTPDPAYGPQGLHQISDLPSFATGPYGAQFPSLGTLAMASSDRLLIGVEAEERLVVGRRLADGSADAGFGTSGWAAAPTVVSKPAAATALALPNGRVVAVAGSYDHPCAAAARFLADGEATMPLGPTDGKQCADTCKPVHGCPTVLRELTIAVHDRGPGRTITGLLTAAPTGCDSPVDLFKPRPGSDRYLRTDRTLVKVGKDTYRYAFHAGRAFSAKSVFTRVRTELDPEAGTCGGARSHVTRIR
jgi:uncharacterized delta-60 repeat protein